MNSSEGNYIRALKTSNAVQKEPENPLIKGFPAFLLSD